MAQVPLGRVVLTPAALSMLAEIDEDALIFLDRHQQGDWGDLGQDDKEANDHALLAGTRLLSSYQTRGGTLWIITEADRSATTVLLPSDY